MTLRVSNDEVGGCWGIEFSPLPVTVPVRGSIASTDNPENGPAWFLPMSNLFEARASRTRHIPKVTPILCFFITAITSYGGGVVLE